MSIEFRDLEILAAVARHGTFTAAAAACGISQPAVSVAIQRIEGALGVKVFERSRRGAALTAAGREAVERANRLLAERDAMIWELGKWEGRQAGSLHLGTTDAVSAYLLPPVYRAFRERYPNVSLRVSVADSAQLSRSLLDAQIDMAVLTLPPPQPQLTTWPVFTEQMVPVFPPNADIPRDRPLHPAEVSDLPMIGYPSTSVTRRAIDNGMKTAGLTPRIEMEVSAPDVMVSLVSSGLGFAVLPDHVVEPAERSGSVVRASIAGFTVTRQLGFAAVGVESLTPAASALMALTSEVLGLDVITPVGL